MDTVGTFSLSWAKGYAGGRAEFICANVLCFKCGSNVAFVGEDGKETLYSTNDACGIGQLAVHGINSVFAYSEHVVDPKIHIVQFPSLLTIHTLTDGATLEFVSLTFSTSEYLASISGLPQYQLIIWKYVDETKLIVHDLEHITPTWVAFNPGNWRQIAISTKKELVVWNAEQNNDQYYMTKRSYKMPRKPIKSPSCNDSIYQHIVSVRGVDGVAQESVHLPLSAVAGLHGDQVDHFDEFEDTHQWIVPAKHCWLPCGDILVGCQDGELLRIHAESHDVVLMVCHQLTDGVESHETILESVSPSTLDLRDSASHHSHHSHHRPNSSHHGHLSNARQSGDTREVVPEHTDASHHGHLSNVQQNGATDAPHHGHPSNVRQSGLAPEHTDASHHGHPSNVRQSGLAPEHTDASHHGHPSNVRQSGLAPEHTDAPHHGHLSNARLGSASRVVEPEHADTHRASHAVCTSFCKPLSWQTSGLFTCIAQHKKLLFTGGENGVLLQFSVVEDHAQLVTAINTHVPITSLCFNPSHHKLAIGSSKGQIYLYNTDSTDDDSLRLVLDVSHSTFIAVCGLASSSNMCVTLCESGDLQVWKADTGKMMSSISLGIAATSIGTSPLTNVAFVGSMTGHVHIVSLVNVAQPIVVSVIRLHREPVRRIVFTPNGSLALTGSSDGIVFVLDGRPSKKFEVVGYIGVIGIVLNIATYLREDSQVQVMVTCCKEREKLGKTVADKFYSFHIPQQINSDAKSLSKYEFKPESINLLSFFLSEPSHGLVVTNENMIYIMSDTTKKIHKILVPHEKPKQDRRRDSLLPSLEQHEGHLLPGGLLRLSPHQRWLVSAGADGRVIVKFLTSLDHKEAEFNAHSFWSGGVADFAFSPDGMLIFTIGYDGTLCCFHWDFAASGKEEHQIAVDVARKMTDELKRIRSVEDSALRMMEAWTEEVADTSEAVSHSAKLEAIEKAIEEAIANDEIYTPAVIEPPKTATWLDFKLYESMKEEDKAFADVKYEIREEIREMRRRLQKMMAENENLPQIEKLARHEFELDMEEQKQLQARCEVEVQKLREDKEFDNLAKMYLTDIIRQECWEEMMVKGRGLLAFNTQLEVYNFPLRARTSAETDLLEIVKAQRTIEIAELTARKEIVDSVMAVRHKPLNSEDDALEVDSSTDTVTREKSTLMGSLADVVGDVGELYYNQFEMCSREQKINQIVLLENTIYQIKTQYNKEFDEVFVKKELEIAKIKEKNKRIRKILDDLNMNEPIFQPELGPVEKPEMLLVTTDDEVKVEKFLTPEQWKKMEQDRKNEEERRLRERGDNWRERGLDQMMGGVLEIKKEDELKKDIPIPQFLQEKKEEEWTDEEKKAAAEYHRKVKELEEERDKFRKQLELELRKLQAMVQEGTQNFDEVLTQLFMKKVRSELVIFQEELKILRLRYSILQEEEMSHHERELIDLIEKKKLLSQTITAEVISARKQLEEFRTEYDILVSEDRALDKGFRREFADLSNLMCDQLYKHFRKRPRGQRAKILDPAYDHSSANPFADRPSTARRNEEAQRALQEAIHEMDGHLPDNTDSMIWERLCRYRKEKIEFEMRVKQKALTLADMQAFVQRRQEEDEALKNEIEELGDSLMRLRSDRQLFFTNLEIQLLLKQGQVEVDAGSFIADFRDCLLIHRGVVEELNQQVKLLSDSKIASMVESKDFRKGIIQLEWEHKKMTMEMEDLQNKMRDIMSMKVTREIQAYLSEPDYDARKAQETAGLEQTIQAQKQQHEKLIKEKKRMMKQINKSIDDLKQKNESLMRELEALNVAVNERRHIRDISGGKKTDKERADVYKEILQRRRLVDLAKAQSQEVAVLRAEVERLRMRTFAALVQVEH